LKSFDEGYKISHDEAYKRFAQSQLAPPDDLPSDPFSPEYRDQYLKLYKKISTRDSYSVQNERSQFDVDSLTYRPFPYFTKSLRLAAIHYTLMGKLFEILDLKANSKILECGFGWGNTTLALAMLGHNVTALDIEERYCEVVRRRAEILRVDNIELVNSDFLWVEMTEKKFDAVIFFESFHHCWEFERLLKALHRVMLPGGKIYFAAEPINTEFTTPWGVRLDGESLWVARNAGWMELGFHSDFFEELLARTGWVGSCLHPHFWVASSASEPIVIQANDARLSSLIGSKTGEVLEVEAPKGSGSSHFAMFGPYIGLPKMRFQAAITIDTKTRSSGPLTIDVCHDAGAKVLSTKLCSEQEIAEGTIRIDFEPTERAKDLEVRLQVPGGYVGTITQLSFLAI
jgi:ubiquinone/menaquinone biosynthesis C-methylase UbiE